MCTVDYITMEGGKLVLAVFMCIGFKLGFRKRQAHIFYNHPGSILVSGEAAWLVQGLTTIVNLCNSIDNVTEFVVLSMEVYTFKRSDYININL